MSAILLVPLGHLSVKFDSCRPGTSAKRRAIRSGHLFPMVSSHFLNPDFRPGWGKGVEHSTSLHSDSGGKSIVSNAYEKQLCDSRTLRVPSNRFGL